MRNQLYTEACVPSCAGFVTDRLVRFRPPSFETSVFFSLNRSVFWYRVNTSNDDVPSPIGLWLDVTIIRSWSYLHLKLFDDISFLLNGSQCVGEQNSPIE